MKTSNKKIKFFLQLLGPLIFIYILFKIDYQLIFKEIKLLKWQLLIFSLAIMTFEIIIRSLRWRIILSSLNIVISRAASLSLYWMGIFVGVITPGRIGEVIKVYFLKNKGHSAFRSFFSIVLDRIIDILVLLLLGFLIFLFFLQDVGLYVVIIGVILLLGVVFIFLLINPKSFVHKIFGKLIQKIIPVDFNSYNRFTPAKFWQGIKGLRKKEVAYFFVYLVISWFLYFYPRYIIAESLGLNLSFINIIVISTVVAIVSILPISIAGIGTREAAMIYLFSLFSLSKEAAVLFSLLIFAMNIIVVSFGIVPYLKESALINKVKVQANEG